MAFNAYGATKTASADKVSDVNWDELNQYVVDTCNLQDRETLVGYVSGIVDLGTQKLPDAEYVFEGDEDDEAVEIEKDSSVYFKDGFDSETCKPCRLKCKPQKNQQCISLCVDFPDIMLNKGNFFGKDDAEEKPLRLWMGNSFFLQNHGMVIGRPTPLKVTNLDKTRKTKKWSLAQNSILYKMAVAAKLIKAGECFLPQDIDKLIGEAFQFSVQVYFKPGKDGKQYYTEYIAFVGALGRGQSKPEQKTSPFIIQFMEKNNEEALKELRNHVVNTMKMASNWEDSVVKKQLEALKNTSDSDTNNEDEDETPEEAPVKVAPAKKVSKPKVNTPVEEFDDSDLPF